MGKRFLVATDEGYYPATCFKSVKYKVNFGEEFKIAKDVDFAEIYDKETDSVYSLQELFETNKLAYVGEAVSYPCGKECGIEEDATIYVLLDI